MRKSNIWIVIAFGLLLLHGFGIYKVSALQNSQTHSTPSASLAGD